jgi:multisubunit Na+/H+ antiporter MnhF subunit
MSLFDIHTWADARSLLYTATAPVVAYLVYLGVVDGQQAALWIALAAAVLSPLLSAANTVTGFRKWFYPVVAAASGVLVGLGIFTDNQVSPVIAIVTALVGSAVAGANTPTSSSA